MLELRFDAPASVTAWAAIDDRVMGGVSRSRMRWDPGGFAVFEGRVSTAHGGGFASVRHGALALGGPAGQAYRLLVQGDGKRYALNLRTDDVWDGVQYQAVFEALAGPWQAVSLPVADFAARWRGRPVSDAPILEPCRVRQVGLRIGGGQTGDFRLALHSIACH
jgi:NADH dehydrogenase [ubiquinone] 1 alpha subcomplex assembly factor 1